MQTDTQTDIQAALNRAVIDAAVSTEDASSGADKEPARNERPRSPLSGAPVPGGRPKGVQNKVTRTIREAVEKAARECHPEGLAGWLIERAQGSLGDRQIFAQMVNKAMPLQVQAQVGGGVQIQLSWLGGRQIGTTAAQQADQRTQVLDLQAEKDGTYRIIDPVTQPSPASASPENADPLPPIDRQGGARLKPGPLPTFSVPQKSNLRKTQ